MAKAISRGQRRKLKAKVKNENGVKKETEDQTNGYADDAPDSLDIKSSIKSEPDSPSLKAVKSNAPEPSPFVLDENDQFENKELMEQYAYIFTKFRGADSAEDDEEKAGSGNFVKGKGEIIYSDDEGMPSDDEDAQEEQPLSKRKQRKINRLSVAELKRLVRKPEIVEWVDVTASDPKLLVTLKSYRNTIPVPAHWAQKKDYLQGKRGIEKPPFKLPSFIADTGIATQRDAIKEKEANQSLKQKTRERVQPKMGKIDIDYQKLYDAFFKFQTKPPMTNFGEVYYEGKEFETHLKERRPGELSPELKEALSIPPLAPPPWLIAMQRYGPPPSYPNLKIPGLSAPIPEGAQWGFHAGGWGRPPTDEYNRPLYGDVFGLSTVQDQGDYEPVDKGLWGELEPEEEEEEEDEEEEEEEEGEGEEGGEEEDAAGLQTPAVGQSGLETPSGFASVSTVVPGGIETPDVLELRKRTSAQQPSAPEDSGPRQLYQVIPEKQGPAGGFLGGERTYDVGSLGAGTQHGPNVAVLGQEDRHNKRKADDVDVALDPSELASMSQEELQKKYEASRARKSGPAMGADEDLSQVYLEEMSKRRKKAQASEKFKF